MSLLGSILGINLPGLAGENTGGTPNPFAGLVSGGLPMVPPAGLGQGFQSLIPALGQALRGQLGQPPAQPPPAPPTVPMTQAQQQNTQQPVPQNPSEAPAINSAVAAPNGNPYYNPRLAAILADPAQRARLPAGMRNNNPGNIKYAHQSDAIGPSQNTDEGDPQAVYASPEAGFLAMHNLLSKKYNGGKLTANQMIAGPGGWTPGNFEAAANVARTAGINPNQDINFNDPGSAARFMRGLVLQEHGPSSNLYTDQMIAAAAHAKPGDLARIATADPSRPFAPGETLHVPSGRTGAGGGARVPAANQSNGAGLDITIPGSQANQMASGTFGVDPNEQNNTATNAGPAISDAQARRMRMMQLARATQTYGVGPQLPYTQPGQQSYYNPDYSIYQATRNVSHLRALPTVNVLQGLSAIGKGIRDNAGSTYG